jgi:heptosyltransferase-2
VRKYRYSRWRWRVLVRVLDGLGGLMMALWRLVHAPRQIDAPRRILLVQLDHLGDAVLSSPLFPRLKAAYPDARIEVLASPSNAAFFAADPNVAEVHVAARNWFERRPGGWALWSAVWALGRGLRPRRFDLGIDVRGDVLTVLVLALAGIPRRVGWAMGGGGFLLTDVAGWEPGRHEVRARLALLKALGLPDGELDPDATRVHAHVTDRDRARVARLLREAWPRRSAPARPRRRRALRLASRLAAAGDGSGLVPAPYVDDPDRLHAGRFGAEAPLLVAHLGAGTAAKRWPPRHWAALIPRFLQDGWRVVIVGGAEDAALAAALAPHANLRDWTGRLAVTETAALLERADLFVGADSGPAHLAACAGTTSVVLFSGTNLARQWRPWSRRTLVLRHRVACNPCHRKICPLADHPCLAGISPDRVHRAAARWWSRVNRAETPHAPL